jgi:hypothetical protein
MDGWKEPSNTTQTGGWKIYSLIRTFIKRKQTPTKAMEVHIDGGPLKERTLM